MPRMTIVPRYAMLVLLVAVVSSSSAQEVQKLDSALDQIVPPKAVAERIATGFNKWTEGPVWTREDSLLFAEIPANNIVQWTPGKGASVFIHPSGYTGAAPYGGPEPGSNGMTLDADGRVTVAGHARRNVWRLETVDPKAQITVLADSYEGKKLNSPNDLVYKSDGSLYFTDPPTVCRPRATRIRARNYKSTVFTAFRRTTAEAGHAARAGQTAVSHQRSSQAERHRAFSPTKNSCTSPTRARKSDALSRAARRFGNRRRPFPRFRQRPADGSPDGIRVDQKGNIYGSGPGGVWIISPEGKHLGTIKIPSGEQRGVGRQGWQDPLHHRQHQPVPDQVEDCGSAKLLASFNLDCPLGVIVKFQVAAVSFQGELL